MKELILVNESEFTTGEYRTLNIYEKDGTWVSHWEDDDSHTGATYEEVRAAAFAEATERWPGYYGPWATIEEAREAMRPANEAWARKRLGL